MSGESREFRKHAKAYDPIKIGSIDGTDTEPHDHAILRAIHSEYIPNQQVKGDPHRTIFIGRLHPRTTEDTMKTEFSKFGHITHCRVVKDIVTGCSKRYAFVSFDSHGATDRAHRSMHGELIDGSRVVVEYELERVVAGWKPRRLGGGLGGRKESGQLRFGCRDRPFRAPILVKPQVKKEERKDRNK